MENYVKFCVKWFIVCLLVFHSNVNGEEDDHGDEDHAAMESSLLSHLFSNYNTISMPFNPDGPVVVKLGMALFKMVDLDEKHQILFSSLWMRMSWTDNRLKWNTTEFEIEDLHIPYTHVWRPDITLYNDVGEDEKSLDKYPVKVHSDGSVLWLAPVLYKSYCRLDVRYFPYDQQVCPLRFGSWSFHGDHLLLTNMSESGDTSEFVDNGEWELVAMPLKTSIKSYQCCSGTYALVTFYIVMKRRALYYVFNIIIPCILIVAVSLLSFYLPPESGEKVSLVVTVLLALTVFMLLIADIMPPQADVVPFIAIYFACIIALLCLTTTMTVMIINLQYSGNHGNRVPPWLKRILFGWLARPLCLNELIQLNLDIVKNSQVQPDGKEPVTSIRSLKQLEENYDKLPSTENLLHQSRSNLNGNVATFNGENNTKLTNKESLPPIADLAHGKKKCKCHCLKHEEDKLAKILTKLEIYDGDRRIKRQIELTSLEWELTVLVIDRLLLVIFFILTVIVNLTFLVYRPDTSTYTLD